MASFIKCAFHTKHHSVNTGALLIDLHTITAQTALLTPAGRIEIAHVTTGAMGSPVCGTVYTKLSSVGHRTVIVIVRTVAAQTAVVTKMFNAAIAFVASGAVALTLFYGAIKAKAHSMVGGARNVYFNTFSAQTALLAPFSHNKIASLTVGAVCTLLNSTLQTHIVADLLVGAAVTNFRAGTIGTLAALDAQIYTRITLVAFLAIGRAVNKIFTIGTAMRRKDCE